MSGSLRAAAASAILIIPVALELAWHPFGDHAVGLEIFAASQVVGWLLVLSACRGAAPSGRSARVGRRFVLAGCWLEVTFGIVYAATVTDGEPPGAVFGLFLLGFLALFIGGTTWGLGLAGTSHGRLAGWALVATAGLGLCAMLFGGDPWHDVFLISSYAAWAVVGRGLDSLQPSHPEHGLGAVADLKLG